MRENEKTKNLKHTCKRSSVSKPWYRNGNGCHDSCWQPQTYVKPEAAITVFELLMMNGVSLETCW